MKKLMIAAFAVLPVILTACVATPGQTGASNDALGTATTIGTNVLKVAVDNQCRTTLNANNAWRIFALTQTAEKQAELESKVCGCVSEKAPQNVTAVELAQAALDQNARAQIVANTVTKTLNACYSEFVNK